MKRPILAVSLAVLAIAALTSFKLLSNSTSEQNDNMTEISYSLGVNIGSSLQDQGFEKLDYEALISAIKDVYEKRPLQISPEEANQKLGAYMQSLSEKKNKGVIEAGQKFLAENGKRSEVTTLPSGLQYEVLTKGDGPKPGLNDQVTTHYHGTLPDGTVFDSSVQRGQPATFPVNGVIAGWTEALQLMPVGSKWKLFVPSNLAYGERGAGGKIGPHQVLVFEVELISIN